MKDQVIHMPHPSKVTKRLIMFTLVCTITGFDYVSHGSNFLEPYIKDFENSSITANYHEVSSDKLNWIWSFTSTSRSIAALCGFLLLPYTMNRFGRRITGMLLSNSLLLVAIVLQVLAYYCNRYEVYMAGQFVQGFGASFTPALVLFMAESVPDSVRGITSMLTNAGAYALIAFGAVCSFVWLFGNPERWMLYPLVAIPLCLPQILTFRYFPGSPKFLYIVRKDEDRAAKSAKFYHGEDTNTELLFAHYKRESDLALEKEQDSLYDILTNRHLRIPFILCLIANLAATVSGNSIKGSYLDEIFISFGIAKEMATIPIMFIYLAATIIGIFTAIFLVEKVGRRPLMVFSQLLDMIGILCMVMADVLAPSNLASLMGFLGALILTIALNVGLDKLPMLFIAEMCPLGSRAVTASAVSVVCLLVSMAQTFLYPPIHTKIGYWAWMVLLLLEFITFIIMFLFLPETKNRGVEEIVNDWIEHGHYLKVETLRKWTRSLSTLSRQMSFANRSRHTTSNAISEADENTPLLSDK